MLLVLLQVAWPAALVVLACCSHRQLYGLLLLHLPHRTLIIIAARQVTHRQLISSKGPPTNTQRGRSVVSKVDRLSSGTARHCRPVRGTTSCHLVLA
jgi:hypothetical protein